MNIEAGQMLVWSWLLNPSKSSKGFNSYNIYRDGQVADFIFERDSNGNHKRALMAMNAIRSRAKIVGIKQALMEVHYYLYNL